MLRLSSAIASLTVLLGTPLGASLAAAAEPAMPWITVSADKKGFVLTPGDTPFTPVGFNYDHDEAGRLIEDYWLAEWDKIESDVAEMKALGANVVRVHLQFGKFMQTADQPNQQSLDKLAKLLALAERVGLYLDLTGLGCYHKQDVPAWYDALTEEQRWNVQSRFWELVAERCASSPAVFCYDLMNEPIVPGGPRKPGEWLGGAFAGKHFVQFVSLDRGERSRPEVARQWISQLTAAIRKHDPRHLVTVGLVDWSLDRPGLTSGFVPRDATADLDFLCVHLYPKTGKLDEALDTLSGFAIGKPLVIEETFPMHCSPQELSEFVARSKQHASGWISFYWGQPPAELKASKTFGDALLLQWLERFPRSSSSPSPP